MLEERSQPTGAYIFYTTYLFRTNVFNYFIIPFRIPITYAPDFYFRDSSSQPHFVTPTHNSNSQLTFATPILNLLFRNHPVMQPHH